MNIEDNIRNFDERTKKNKQYIEINNEKIDNQSELIEMLQVQTKRNEKL